MFDPYFDPILYWHSAWHNYYRMCHRSHQLFKCMATCSDTNGCLLRASTSWNGRLHEGQSELTPQGQRFAQKGKWRSKRQLLVGKACFNHFIDESFHSNKQRFGFDISSELDWYNFWMAWISIRCWRLLLSLDTTAVWVAWTESHCWYDWALK